MKKQLLIVVCLFVSFITSAQITLTGTSYTQDFNGLPNTGTTNAWVNNSTLLGWYAERGAGTTAGTSIATVLASTGSSTTGALYSFGSTSANDRAMGSTCSNAFGNVSYGVRVLNQTGGAIASITVSYTGEQWRKENNASANKIQFAYKTGANITSLDATSLTNGGYTAVATLDFTSPQIGATTAAVLDGNLPANKMALSSVTITFPTALANGQEIMLKWFDVNDSGNDHQMGIDDLSITFTPAAPTLTATPTTLSGFNYTVGSSSSTVKSYTLSGSILSPALDSVKVTAPTNYEVSLASDNTGFADSLKIPYTNSTLSATTVYVRLKLGLAENTYNGNITHRGGAVATPPTVALTGSVTNVPPAVLTVSASTLTAFSYAETFGPSSSGNYTVSGINLLPADGSLTLTAPTNFEVSANNSTFADNLPINYTGGTLTNTMVYVRLKAGLAIGSYGGSGVNVILSGGNGTSQNTQVSGIVKSNCGTAETISAVRALITEANTFSGTPKTISGTVSAIFGTGKFYMQDATGSIAIFFANVVPNNGLAIGDVVKVTGPTARFNGEAELVNLTCVAKIGTTTPIIPVAFDANNPPSGVNLPTFLANNEGRLVKLVSANIIPTGSFANSSNYAVSACNGQGDTEIRIDASTNISNTAIPSVTQDITGVIGHYINASNSVNILQVFPTNTSDFMNSAVSCVPVVVPVNASCGPLAATDIAVDSTLDVTAWNVEWLGNTTTSPSALGPINDAQQMNNVMTVMNTLKSDVFCIEEVCDHRQFITRVNSDLPGYKAVCQTKYYSHFSDTPETLNNATTYSQKVCFVYRQDQVTLVDTLSLLANKYAYTNSSSSNANNWASGRLPYMFVADVTINNKTKRIHFVGLHAKSGSDASSYTRRNQDVIDLKAELDTNYPTANIVMLGDYNDDLDGSIYVGRPSTYANFVNDSTNYLHISKALSDCRVSSTASYPDIIDHIMLSNEFGIIAASGPNPTMASTSGMYYLEKTINTARPTNYISNYTTSTSDHFPINARITFGLPASQLITSVNTGNWSAPTTWNCNCVPTSSDNVIIDTAHTVTIDATSSAKSVNVKGILNYIGAFVLSLGM
jgi:hypothetical protein